MAKISFEDDEDYKGVDMLLQFKLRDEDYRILCKLADISNKSIPKKAKELFEFALTYYQTFVLVETEKDK